MLSALVKLLVLPANVRLDWKVIASYKHSSLFGLVGSDKGKKFYNIEHRKAKSKMGLGLGPPIIASDSSGIRSFHKQVLHY
jgi:hypothetical protein